MEKLLFQFQEIAKSVHNVRNLTQLLISDHASRILTTRYVLPRHVSTVKGNTNRH